MLLVETGYVTPDGIKLFEDIGAVAVAVTAVTSVLYGIYRLSIWFDHKRDDRFAGRVKDVVEPIIKDATKPIQPDTNGGRSLGDLHDKFDAMSERMVVVEAKLGIVERRDKSERRNDEEPSDVS